MTAFFKRAVLENFYVTNVGEMNSAHSSVFFYHSGIIVEFRTAKTAAAEDLLALKAAWEEKLNEMLPVTTQLLGSSGRGESVESGFLI